MMKFLTVAFIAIALTGFIGMCHKIEVSKEIIEKQDKLICLQDTIILMQQQNLDRLLSAGKGGSIKWSEFVKTDEYKRTQKQ